MIWEQMQSQVRFHTQALNIPIDVQRLSNEVFAQSDPEVNQVVFKENQSEPVKSEEFLLRIARPLTEDNLKIISKVLEDHLPALA